MAQEGGTFYCRASPSCLSANSRTACAESAHGAPGLDASASLALFPKLLNEIQNAHACKTSVRCARCVQLNNLIAGV